MPDEAGFDETPGPRDSTGETVRSSVCPEVVTVGVARPAGTPEGRGQATFVVPSIAGTALHDHALPQSLQGVPPMPMDVGDSEEEPPDNDEAGFDGSFDASDSTGETVDPSPFPGLLMDLAGPTEEHSGRKPRRTRSRRERSRHTRSQAENPIFAEVRDLIRNAYRRE